MKKVFAGLLAGLLLGTAGIAGASSERTSQDMIVNGIWCKPMVGGVGCVAMDGSRYGVGLTKNLVMVYDDRTKKTIFVRQH